MIFASLILMPVAREELSPQVRFPLFKKIGVRFRWVSWISLLVLIGTGTYKVFAVAGTLDWMHSPLGIALLIKFLLVFLMALLSFLHDFVWGLRITALAASPQSREYQSTLFHLAFWARVNLVLGTLIVFVAAFIRMNPF